VKIAVVQSTKMKDLAAPAANLTSVEVVQQIVVHVKRAYVVRVRRGAMAASNGTATIV
jgi:hypothetical protein